MKFKVWWDAGDGMRHAKAVQTSTQMSNSGLGFGQHATHAWKEPVIRFVDACNAGLGEPSKSTRRLILWALQQAHLEAGTVAVKVCMALHFAWRARR